MVGRQAFVVLLLLTVALSMAAASSLSSHLDNSVVTAFAHHSGDGELIDSATGRIGDTLFEDEEKMMPSESARRTLIAPSGYISYEAMMRNSIPCDKRGRSYYNCVRMQSARTYRRGCNKITRCQRRRPK